MIVKPCRTCVYPVTNEPKVTLKFARKLITESAYIDPIMFFQTVFSRSVFYFCNETNRALNQHLPTRIDK